MSLVLLIVNGRFGTGKTYMARQLARDLKLPLINRDHFKESIYDELNPPPQEVLDHMGPISWGAFWSATAQLLAAGVSHVLESNFSPKSATRLQRLINQYGARGIQVHLWNPLEVSLKRSLERIETGQRHPVHVKERALADLPIEERASLLSDSSFMRSDDQPMALEMPLIQVDSSDFAQINYSLILDSVKEALRI